MIRLKWIFVTIILIVAIIVLAGLYKFKYKVSQPGYDEDGNKVEATQKVKVVTDFSGNYVTEEYYNRSKGYDWLVLIVKKNTDNSLQVSIRSRSDNKKSTCSFEGVAKFVSKNLYEATSRENSFLISLKGDKINISSKSENDLDKNNLRWFCSGGASLADYTFIKLYDKLDQTQLNGKN